MIKDSQKLNLKTQRKRQIKLVGGWITLNPQDMRFFRVPYDTQESPNLNPVKLFI